MRSRLRSVFQSGLRSVAVGASACVSAGVAVGVDVAVGDWAVGDWADGTVAETRSDQAVVSPEALTARTQ